MRTMRRQGRVESPGPSRGWRLRDSFRPLWPLAGHLEPGTPRTPELREMGHDVQRLAAGGQGVGVLDTSTTQTLTLTTVGLSPGAAAQLGLYQHHGVL